MNPSALVVGIEAGEGSFSSLKEFFYRPFETKNVSFILRQNSEIDFKKFIEFTREIYGDEFFQVVKMKIPIERGRGYIVPPGYRASFLNGFLEVEKGSSSFEKKEKDFSFSESLVKQYSEKSVLLILSGAEALENSACFTFFEQNGLVFSESPLSAEVSELPESALSTRVVDKVLESNELRSFFDKYLVCFESEKKKPLSPEENEPDIKKILSLLLRKYSLDLSLYKRKRVFERLQRHMNISLISEFSFYTKELERDSKLLESLHLHLSRRPSRFFCDLEAQHYLKREIIPYLFQLNADSREIRVWVSACATGEAPYSIALLLREYSEKLKNSYTIKVFASDSNKKALEEASLGVYKKHQVASVNISLREKFFQRKGNNFVVSNELRSMVVFVPQSSLVDSFFTKMDFIYSHNLLYELTPKAQGVVLRGMLVSLKKNGILFLGPKEDLGEYENYFFVESQKYKVYRKIDSYKVSENSLRKATKEDYENLLEEDINSLKLQLEEAQSQKKKVESAFRALRDEYSLAKEELGSVSSELSIVSLEFQKKREEISQLEGDIDNLLQSSHIGTLFLKKDLTIRRITPAISETFSIMSQDVGRSFERFAPEFGHEDLLEVIRSVLDSGQEKILEPKKYGQSWFSLKVMPYRMQRDIAGVVIAFLDFSHLKQMEAELRIKDLSLERRERELDDFAYFSAHDLKGMLRSNRTHLTHLKNIIPEGFQVSKEMRELEKDGRVLHRIANCLVQFSDLGRRKYKKIELDVHSVVEKAILSVETQGVRFILDDSLNCVMADPESLRFIFSELIKNGISFNTSESKIIQIGFLGSSNWDDENIFYVRDNGIGIRKEDSNKVFMMFKKLNRENEFQRGEGVGLSFCRRHVEKNGGSIWLESEPDIGTTVYFSLPN